MALTDIDMKELGLSIQMVGAVYGDKDTLYVVTIPGALEPNHRRVLDALPAQDYGTGVQLDEIRAVHLTHEEWQAFLRQTDLVEVEALVKDPETKQVGKAIIRKSERQISQNVSWAVYRRDGFRCRYCGVEDQPLTVDHLITWESGGPSTPENLVASCRKCNGARGETPYAEWLDSPYYRRVSAGLDYQTRFANQALIPTLARIPVSVRTGKRKR